MKKILTAVCIALVMLSACQKNEFDSEVVPSQDERVALGIGSATASVTKALVRPGIQTTDGMSVGLFATGMDYYPAGTNHTAVFTYSSSKWVTIANIFLTTEIATVYGYHPSTAQLTEHEVTPKIAVSVLETGTEIATISDGGFNAATDEFDFMAFIPANGKGRLANNGKVSETITADNQGDNPGSTIPDLTLVHGMAMLSFRLYNDGTYFGKGDWTKLVLQNAADKQVLSKGTSPTMNLTDASIEPGFFVAATITRTIASGAYTVPVVGAAGITDAVAAKKAANKVSCLVFPVGTPFGDGDMQVALTIDGKTYLPVDIPAAAKWEKGKNCVYTIKLSGAGVHITPWEEHTWEDDPYLTGQSLLNE